MKSAFIIILCLITLGVTQQSARPYESADLNQRIVDRHNSWRAKVGVPPVKWSAELAAFSKRWADHLGTLNCKMMHSPSDGEFGNGYGENIYWSQGMHSTPEEFVDHWAAEIKYYDEGSGECKGGVCGHYTQIVWKNTTEIGCAMIACGDQEIWVCNYNPPGNYSGQKPY